MPSDLSRMRDDLESLSEQASDLQPLWEAFDREVWEPRQVAHFATIGPPLAKSTAKRRRGGSKTPLVRTGALRLATFRDFSRLSRSSAVFGIPKGNVRARKLAVLHASSPRLKHRRAVPKLQPREMTKFKNLLREHLRKAWDQ